MSLLSPPENETPAANSSSDASSFPFADSPFASPIPAATLVTPSGNHSTPFGAAATGNGGAGRGFAQALGAGALSLAALAFFARAKGADAPTALIRVLVHPSPEAQYVVLLLVFIFAYTLFSVLWSHFKLGAERERFQEIREALPAAASSGQVEGMLRAKLANVSRDTLLVQATQAVWDARHLASPDLEAISASLGALEDNRSGAGTGVGNRLMLLSLLGTILGLAQVISTLDPQIKSASATGDVDAIFQNLQGTLMQMGTAFSSTSWGILLSTLLSWLTAAASARRLGYVAEIQYFAVSELAPRLLTTSPAAAVDTLKEAILQGQSLIQNAEQTIIRATAHQKQMLEDVRNTHEAIETQNRSFVRSVEDALVKNGAQFAQNLANVGDTVIAGAKAQIDAATQLDALLLQSTAEMADAAKSLRGAAGVVQTLDTTLNKIDVTAQKMATDLNGIAPKLQGLMTQQVDTLKDAGEQQAKAWSDRMTRQEANFKSSLEEQQKQLTLTIEEVKKLVGVVQPRLPSGPELDKLRAALESVAKAADTLGRGGSGMGGGANTGASAGSGMSPEQWKRSMSEALEPVLRQLQSGAATSGGVSQQIGQQIQELAREVRTLTQLLQTQKTSLPTGTSSSGGYERPVSNPGYAANPTGAAGPMPDPVPPAAPRPTWDEPKPRKTVGTIIKRWFGR